MCNFSMTEGDFIDIYGGSGCTMQICGRQRFCGDIGFIYLFIFFSAVTWSSVLQMVAHGAVMQICGDKHMVWKGIIDLAFKFSGKKIFFFTSAQCWILCECLFLPLNIIT